MLDDLRERFAEFMGIEDDFCDDENTPKRRKGKVTNATNPAAAVSICRAKKISDAQAIGELICDGRPVIINFEDANSQDAQRIIDFISGIIFCCGGSIEFVSQYVLTATPAQIEVSGSTRTKIKDAPKLLTEV